MRIIMLTTCSEIRVVVEDATALHMLTIDVKRLVMKNMIQVLCDMRFWVRLSRAKASYIVPSMAMWPLIIFLAPYTIFWCVCIQEDHDVIVTRCGANYLYFIASCIIVVVVT